MLKEARAFGDLSENSEYDDAIITEAGKYICTYTNDMICQTFDLEKESISVSVTLERSDEADSEVKIKLITVELNCSEEIDKQAVANLVSERLNCKCVILT